MITSHLSAGSIGDDPRLPFSVEVELNVDWLVAKALRAASSKLVVPPQPGRLRAAQSPFFRDQRTALPTCHIMPSHDRHKFISKPPHRPIEHSPTSTLSVMVESTVPKKVTRKALSHSSHVNATVHEDVITSTQSPGRGGAVCVHQSHPPLRLVRRPCPFLALRVCTSHIKKKKKAPSTRTEGLDSCILSIPLR